MQFRNEDTSFFTSLKVSMTVLTRNGHRTYDSFIATNIAIRYV